MQAALKHPLRILTRLTALAAVLFAVVLLAPRSKTPVAHAQSSVRSASSDVRIGVMGLFHPREFELSATMGQALVLQASGQTIVLEKSSGIESARIQLSDSEVVVTTGARTLRASEISVAGRQNEPVDFVLSIAGKISRLYHGTVDLEPSSNTLLAIVTLNLETAVASVVAAESTADTPVEALRAQAIATRSYFVAGRGRHHDFDFCDTTHCQFLRNPPAPGSVVANAVDSTRGLVLEYNSHTFAAMYTHSCSGYTRTPAELGLSAGTYPYYHVPCEYCRQHPVQWSSRVSARDAATLRSSDESSRLNIVRRLGWSVVPSNTFSVTKEGELVLIEGTGHGHGIGLCQSGARAMAEQGVSFRDILSHYYPNTTVVRQ